jgi:hypothetical protein
MTMTNYTETKNYLFIIMSCFFSTCFAANSPEIVDELLRSGQKKVVKERERERESHCHRRTAYESHHEPCHRAEKGTEENRLKVKTVRILEIDGGAMRGIMPATVLKKIEEETRQPIADLFHVVGGTSVGCLLSCGLTIPSETNKSKPRWSAKQLSNML